MSLSASCLSLNPHLFDWRRKLSLSVTRKYSSHAAGRLQREQERWHSERKHAQRRKRGNRLAFPQTSDLRFPPILVCGARASAVMLYPGPEEAAWEPRARHTPVLFPGWGTGTLAGRGARELRSRACRPALPALLAWVPLLLGYRTSVRVQVMKALRSVPASVA